MTMAEQAAENVDDTLEMRGTTPRAEEENGREKRYIYNGDPPPSTAGYVIRPNRRGTHRKTSTFNIILALFTVGGLIVLCVNNIVTVNQLADDVGRLRTQEEECRDAVAVLRAEVERKSSRERIEKIATEQLGMTYPREQPAWFSPEPDDVASLREK
jgi:cell division protein FtsL